MCSIRTRCLYIIRTRRLCSIRTQRIWIIRTRRLCSSTSTHQAVTHSQRKKIRWFGNRQVQNLNREIQMGAVGDKDHHNLVNSRTQDETYQFLLAGLINKEWVDQVNLQCPIILSRGCKTCQVVYQEEEVQRKVVLVEMIVLSYKVFIPMVKVQTQNW